jgi:hypothetical protein
VTVVGGKPGWSVCGMGWSPSVAAAGWGRWSVPGREILGVPDSRGGVIGLAGVFRAGGRVCLGPSMRWDLLTHADVGSRTGRENRENVALGACPRLAISSTALTAHGWSGHPCTGRATKA